MKNQKAEHGQLAPHMVAGKDGEAVAAQYLAFIGYRIIGRNIRINKDEIDIVAFDPGDNVYVFAEVKTRSAFSDDFHPNINVTWKKHNFMRRAARRYMTQFEDEIGYRLDVICIMHGKVVDHFIEITRA